MILRIYEGGRNVKQAQDTMGEFLEFAVHRLHLDLRYAYNMFLASSWVRGFQHGDEPIEIVGTELLARVLTEKKVKFSHEGMRRFIPSYNQTYWTGWAIAEYQWYSTLPFIKIDQYIPIEHVFRMYFPFHEMDISRFNLKMDEIYLSKAKITNLEKIRKICHLSRRELADMAGTEENLIASLEARERSIYDIPVADALNLARAMRTSIDNILEYEPKRLNEG